MTRVASGVSNGNQPTIDIMTGWMTDTAAIETRTQAEVTAIRLEAKMSKSHPEDQITYES